MKKLREKIGRRLEMMDERWKALPMRKQHQYVLYFFVAYLLVTAGAIFKAWQDTEKPGIDMAIEPIEIPVLEQRESPVGFQDKVETDKKNNYERK